MIQDLMLNVLTISSGSSAFLNSKIIHSLKVHQRQLMEKMYRLISWVILALSTNGETGGTKLKQIKAYERNSDKLL